MLFIISGPSGCGKSTLAQRVLKKVDNVQFSVSHTTRDKRKSEKEGKDYYFVSKPEFEQMIKEERLIEWTVFHGNHYGTSKREVEKKGSMGDLLLDIDVHGAELVKSKLKKAVFIFILPPSYSRVSLTSPLSHVFPVPLAYPHHLFLRSKPECASQRQ